MRCRAIEQTSWFLIGLLLALTSATAGCARKVDLTHVSDTATHVTRLDCEPTIWRDTALAGGAKNPLAKGLIPTTGRHVLYIRARLSWESKAFRIYPWCLFDRSSGIVWREIWCDLGDTPLRPDALISATPVQLAIRRSLGGFLVMEPFEIPENTSLWKLMNGSFLDGSLPNGKFNEMVRPEAMTVTILDRRGDDVRGRFRVAYAWENASGHFREVIEGDFTAAMEPAPSPLAKGDPRWPDEYDDR